ncbi:pilus assembly protein [Rhodopseudomonas palustris]|uniref:TadE/TadG family type IV pilus assembly protein n=1 Tax=Rhodopseudomonas palustris TaxID=1076 RepID=UPI0020CD6B45|nr:TadE/TadG family type IV pilus assembly protein [Rhodopseudomonas palustris]MCP9628697.1 pilus assembly protein [Rhodopseudomonas palustris]
MQGLFEKCRATNLFRRFVSDGSGNVAAIFAISLLPLLGFVGAAIDYSTANRVRTKLESAQDAAVLLAVSNAEINKTAADAQADAVKFFNATVGAYGLSATINLSVTDSNGKRSASSNFSTTVTTSFLNLVGYPTLTVGDKSTSTVSMPVYQDFYLLLDNSPSMGVAATTTDIATMVANTSDKCAFACHDLSNSNNYYNLAKKLGVTMRIDVVRQAVQQLTTTATAISAVSNQFRMAVYTFGSSCSSLGLTTISSLTSSMSSVQSAASAIDLMTIPKQNYNNDQCTDFDGTLTAMNSTIPTPGSGTADNPQKWLFFVSDGVADANYPSTCSRTPLGNGRCQEPLTVAQCTAMKNRGVQIAVLYTTYLALPTNDWYNNYIAPFNPGPYGPSTNSQIAANMQNCASPGFYFEVSPTQGISQAMDALFKKAVAKARLSS